MEPLKLKLTTFQRIQLIQIAGAIEGNAAVVRKAVKLLDALDFTDEEKVNIALAQNGNQITWNDEGEKAVWEIELKDPDPTALLTEKLKAHVFPAVVGRVMLPVYDQLGIE